MIRNVVRAATILLATLAVPAVIFCCAAARQRSDQQPV
jgi:hypothetical protein